MHEEQPEWARLAKSIAFFSHYLSLAQLGFPVPAGLGL
jgi:hypothetical protein